MNLFSGLFPLWALAAAAIAYLRPALFTPLAPAVFALLGTVMFAMGLSLGPGSFAAVFRQPGKVVLGVVAQYGVMPAAAYAVALACQLPPAMVAGMVLVGSCPGGTASNVICYLARGDVALSVTLTTLSTLLAVAATPVLTWLYVGRLVPVPVVDMLASVFEVVILPVALGILVRRLAPGAAIARLQQWLPVVAIAAIVVIIAIIVALNHDSLGALTGLLVLAVVAHNLLGMACGYLLAALAGFDVATRRTLAIEVGMQNSGLGVALAIKHFSAIAALPGALFSIWHNVSGSLLAARWSRRPSEGRS